MCPDIRFRTHGHAGDSGSVSVIFKFKIKTWRDLSGMAQSFRGEGGEGKRILSSCRAILSRGTIFYLGRTGGEERGRTAEKSPPPRVD